MEENQPNQPEMQAPAPEPQKPEMPEPKPEMAETKGKKKGGFLKLIIAVVVIVVVAAVVVLGAQGGWFQGFSFRSKLKTVETVKMDETLDKIETVKIDDTTAIIKDEAIIKEVQPIEKIETTEDVLVMEKIPVERNEIIKINAVTVNQDLDALKMDASYDIDLVEDNLDKLKNEVVASYSIDSEASLKVEELEYLAGIIKTYPELENYFVDKLKTVRIDDTDFDVMGKLIRPRLVASEGLDKLKIGESFQVIGSIEFDYDSGINGLKDFTFFFPEFDKVRDEIGSWTFFAIGSDGNFQEIEFDVDAEGIIKATFGDSAIDVSFLVFARPEGFVSDFATFEDFVVLDANSNLGQDVFFEF